MNSDSMSQGERVMATAREIHLRYPREAAQQPEARLLEMVRQSVEACGVLEIGQPGDVVRYAALRVLITPQQRASPLIKGTVIRTISNLKWSSTKRLDFIYKHVIGRAVSTKEMEFGALFVPVIGD